MKRKIFVVSTLLAVILAAGYAVQAGPMGRGGCRSQSAGVGGNVNCDQQNCNEEGGRVRHLDRMTKILGLSDSQREEIEAIMTAHHEENAPLSESMAAVRSQLREQSHSAELDEVKVEELADQQAELMSQMIVSRARMQSQIFALLTPEQQRIAEELGDGGFGPAGRGPGCVPPPGGCGQRPAPVDGAEPVVN
ncbi:MAG: Spy/CpxP family protein refolding chaperone [Proteobacteria bacterium]|nr:Spy/CpxP family protein refolding chaperone [Pseudomonadota bacterium]MBU1715413.1 Spy/CpxP family protein refolding chaperone [Pseudomonadota bacterium]